MSIEEQAAFLAAIMEATGVTEIFVPNELLEGFRPVTIVREEDLMMDGVRFRLVDDGPPFHSNSRCEMRPAERQPIYAEAWIEDRKEIEP